MNLPRFAALCWLLAATAGCKWSEQDLGTCEAANEVVACECDDGFLGRAVCEAPSLPGACDCMSNAPGGGVAELSLSGEHSCARFMDGRAACWGRGDQGQLGDGRSVSSKSPHWVNNLDDILSIRTHGTGPYGHACALLENATLTCWGRGTEGQLGNGATKDARVPEPVDLGDDIDSMALGMAHSCAINTAGELYCWGFNDAGQVGVTPATVGENALRPKRVADAPNVRSVALGARHSCALSEDGSVLCWGSNKYGQLGDGTTKNRFAPKVIAGLRDVAQVSAGLEHSCARLNNGHVKCWGRNQHGQLGDGTVEQRNMPVDVDGLSDVSALALGSYHSCALRGDGSVACFGSNDHGQLGDHSTQDRSEPIDVQQLQAALSLSAGGRCTCAVTAGHEAKCWGDNHYGQLGDGSSTDQSRPTNVRWASIEAAPMSSD